MKLCLADINPEMIFAWERTFQAYSKVEISLGSIVDLASSCVVSPANSYGYMDGGIDLVYRRFFGRQIEHRVQEAISKRPEGYLSVGASLMVPTGHQRIPYLIVAPTMFLPEAVESTNAYRAMRAILRIADKHMSMIEEIWCPGLCTGVGRVFPEDAAEQMALAYGHWQAEQLAV